MGILKKSQSHLWFTWFSFVPRKLRKTKLIECPGSDSLVDTTKKRPTANTHSYAPICAKFSRLQIEFWYERYVIQSNSSRWSNTRTSQLKTHHFLCWTEGCVELRGFGIEVRGVLSWGVFGVALKVFEVLHKVISTLRFSLMF